MPLAAQPAAATSALDPLKPLAAVDFAGQRHTSYKQWAAAAKTLDDQARQAEHDRDWEHAWVWSRKAAAITHYLANEHVDRTKTENKELLKPLLRLVTSDSFRSRIKTSESLLCSRSSFIASAPSPPTANGRASSSMPPPSVSPEPPTTAPMSIKERMAALRGAGLNTGGDEPVMPGSPANRRSSVQFGGAPKPTAASTATVVPTASASVQAPATNASAALRESGSLSRPSSGRGRKRDEVVPLLERLAMDPAYSAPGSAASAPPSPVQVPVPIPAANQSLDSLQTAPALSKSLVTASPQALPPPNVEISSPSPVPPLSAPEMAPEASAHEPMSTSPSAMPSRFSHGYSASVPSARSASPSRASPTKPPKPPALSIQPTSGALNISSASSGEQLGLGLGNNTSHAGATNGNRGSPSSSFPRRQPAPAVEEDDFSPSKFGHFPSITEFESSTTTFDDTEAVSIPSSEEETLSFPSLPSVPLSLPGSAPMTTRPLPSPPILPSNASQAQPQTTGSSVSSFQSALSALPLPSPTLPTAPNGISPAPTAVKSNQQPLASDQSVDFPLANTIFPALLRRYLTLPVELLLLDVRPPQSWSSRITPTSTGGGQADCVCIPPHLLSPALSSQQLADGLPRTSPFHNRHLYDLVIIYDGASSGWTAPGAEGAQAVNRAVYEREFGGKMLKRAPVLLVGGWKAWQATENGTAGGIKQPLMSPGLQRPAEMSGSRGNSPSAKPSYFPLIPPIAPTQALRPASSSPSASVAPAFPLPGDLPARPSSTTASASPLYNHSAPMTVPPAPASLAYPSSRRRSEYVDQTSAYAGYPGSFGSPTSMHSNGSGGGLGSGLGGVVPQRGQSIDYPTLSPATSSSLDRPPPPVAPHRKSSMSISHPPSSVTSSLPQPPPVAATPPLERNASRGALVRSGSLSFPTLSEDGKLVQSSGNEVTYWGDEMVGLSGLKNLGNTCYQNSTLQCLSATEPFSTFFRDGRWKRSVNFNNNLGTKGNLASAYSSLISALWQQEYHFIQPLSFRKSIVKFAPTFDGVDQHDSQEFLAFLLDGLHEDLNRVLIRPEPIPMTPAREAELNTLPTQIAGEKEWQIYKKRNDSLVVDLFQGQYKSRMECLTCHQTSTTFDAFMYLSLPVPTSRIKHKVSLEHCLDSFVKEEVMEKGNAWNCPKCKKARTASKSLTLSRLPPVLLIHLKRFSTKNGVFWDKAETLVEFPIKYLDLTKYMPPPLSATKDPVAEARYREDPRTQTPPYVYELYAVSNHAGSLTTGHYTAFVKSSQRHWKYCDDRTISEADEKDVMSKHAYILFYRRVPAKRSL